MKDPQVISPNKPPLPPNAVAGTARFDSRRFSATSSSPAQANLATAYLNQTSIKPDDSDVFFSTSLSHSSVLPDSPASDNALRKQPTHATTCGTVETAPYADAIILTLAPPTVNHQSQHHQTDSQLVAIVATAAANAPPPVGLLSTHPTVLHGSLTSDLRFSAEPTLGQVPISSEEAWLRSPARAALGTDAEARGDNLFRALAGYRKTLADDCLRLVNRQITSLWDDLDSTPTGHQIVEELRARPVTSGNADLLGVHVQGCLGTRGEGEHNHTSNLTADEF